MIAIGLLILGIAIFTFSMRDQEPTQVFSATVNRDCAPWDGAAFTVQIPWHGGDIINISIWKSPDIKFPTTFSFPDNTGQIGNVILIRPVGLPDPLTGEVWFDSVSEEKVVDGGFRLKGERGDLFEGRFAAEWGSQVALCG